MSRVGVLQGRLRILWILEIGVSSKGLIERIPAVSFPEIKFNFDHKQNGL